ncbi:MAG TPA: hypothetical protein VL156_16555 [Terriglobales bacterium]|jgi:hypothetical protein|nr:hypothetical protein [Terriglobales bacterium]
MRYLFQSAVLAFAAFLSACAGGSPSSTSANGSWSAELSTPAQPQPGVFSFNLTQTNTTLSANTLNFSGLGNLSPCFGAGTILSGNLGPAMMNSSAVAMTMSWTPPGAVATNTMTMQGNLGSTMASGAGTFVLTGQTAGCASQSGTFTMTRAPAHAIAALR